jgi:hypothetical protein
MTCTIWESGYSVVAIPYGMKKEYGQHPSDILPKFRHNWVRIEYSGGRYQLGINDFVEVGDSIDKILEEEQNAEMGHRREALQREIDDMRQDLTARKE